MSLTFKLVLLLFISMMMWPTFGNTAEMKLLSKTSETWDGAPIKVYPKGTPELSVARIVIAAAEVMQFHCHPVPSAAYVISGELDVELGDGKTKTFHKGDIITEVINTAHRGRNLSDTNPVELIVFYAGSKGLGNTMLKSGKDCILPTDK